MAKKKSKVGRGGAGAGSGTASTKNHVKGSANCGATKLQAPKGGGFTKSYGNYDK